MKVIITREGIEIQQSDVDLLATRLTKDCIEVGIGEEYGNGPEGSYARWAEINLTLDEARLFRDWLTSKIETRRE